MKLIAFDIDGCLLNTDDTPNEAMVELLRVLSKQNQIVVWSGGGKEYVITWCSRLRISRFVDYKVPKSSSKGTQISMFGKEVDIAFDDEDVTLARFNIRVV